MNLANIALIIALACSVLYFALSVIAANHQNKNSDSNLTRQLIILDPWWAFCVDMFDETGKRVCRRGQLVFVITVSSYLIWAYLKWWPSSQI
jgi:hypothetical protein